MMGRKIDSEMRVFQMKDRHPLYVRLLMNVRNMVTVLVFMQVQMY